MGPWGDVGRGGRGDMWEIIYLLVGEVYKPQATYEGGQSMGLSEGGCGASGVPPRPSHIN